ncbi:TPM domain-containing protein [Synoicihabitans lomoniglobus]|uniref:Uncharacterized protein n=1 Tax=Synoicihabitans lomoniglobus TaxID=2909285 RepID=A0AAE9ZVY4_9BACT|nr:TPM domain-containing protein [Opitutaceae bacterium LMO-M01]WED63865.1 hypothetical protein PXH66_16120 [Opitutaceae bacterium LMO-M01]
MKRWMMRWVWGWGVALGTVLVGAEKVDSPVVDAAQILPSDPAWQQALVAKLDHFEAAAGIRMQFEYHLTSPTAAEDSAPGVYMRRLSAAYGLRQSGVLAVYFADERDWRIWIGEKLTPRFVGLSGTAEEFTADGRMHEAKEAFLAAAFSRSAQVATTANSPAVPRVVAETDALVDGLIAKLSPD